VSLNDSAKGCALRLEKIHYVPGFRRNDTIAGFIRFCKLLYEPGKGNYTKERKELFKDITIEEIIKKSRESQF
jgi:hypothetical protein